MRNLVIVLVLAFKFEIMASQSALDFEKLDDAVVLVEMIDYKGNYAGHGSGFFVDKKGTVVTNYHVVDDAYSLRVKTDIGGVLRTYEVDKILRGDKGKDLAMLSLKNTSGITFPYLKLSTKFPKKGDECWAIGAPDDPAFMNTISKGLVSNFHLNGLGHWTDTLLQINAGIGRGSSGGALLNSKGEVIGVTCGGMNSDNASRAELNFAVWIGLVRGLEYIGATRLVDPNSIPCELGFYTNSPYTGYVYLYIDGTYVGMFNKYFPNNYQPTCHEEGAITRYLYPGKHTYMVYYVATGYYFYGTLDLQPQDCKMIRVGGDSPVTRTNYGPYNTWERFEKEDKGSFRWIVLTGFSFVYTGAGLPPSFYLERVGITGKYSIRGNLQFLNRESTTSSAIQCKFLGLGIDLKRSFIRKYRWDYFLAFTLHKRKLIFSQISNYPTPNTVTEQDLSHLFIGARFGGQRYTGSRWYLIWDIGVGRNTYQKNINADGNILLGFRFG